MLLTRTLKPETASVSQPSAARPPLVLIAGDQDWPVRALESVLGPQGYAVLRAYNGRQALEQASRGSLDAIILSDKLPDMPSLTVCTTLAAKRLISDSTPILLAATESPTREQRLAALRAGASEVFSLPVDGEEFGLRLQNYIRAKFDADRAREQGLVDQSTGLYNAVGLARRARELASTAFRNRSSLACIVFSVEPEGAAEEAGKSAVALVAEAFKQAGRSSDVIGKTGQSEIAIFAPETDQEGAEKLIERLRGTLRQRTGSDRIPGLRSASFAIRNFREGPVEPIEMLLRTSRELQAITDGNGDPS